MGSYIGMFRKSHEVMKYHEVSMFCLEEGVESTFLAYFDIFAKPELNLVEAKVILIST